MRILVADDSLFWREGLREILEQSLDCTVFEANDGSTAVQESNQIHPDVVVLDEWMPVLDGLGAARLLKRVTPELPVLIVTVDKTPFLEAAADEVGALAVFSKTECPQLCNFLSQTLQTRAACLPNPQ